MVVVYGASYLLNKRHLEKRYRIYIILDYVLLVCGGVDWRLSCVRKRWDRIIPVNERHDDIKLIKIDRIKLRRTSTHFCSSG